MDIQKVHSHRFFNIIIIISLFCGSKLTYTESSVYTQIAFSLRLGRHDTISLFFCGDNNKLRTSNQFHIEDLDKQGNA